MTSLAKPIIPNFPITTENRRFFTLHMDSKVFTVQKKGTCIVAFRYQPDCVRFGKLLESHYDLSKEWPAINFGETLLYRSTRSSKLKYLSIKDWTEFNIKMLCIRNSFNMLDIYTFEDDYKLRGNFLSWEMMEDFQRQFLEEKWENS